GAQRLAAESRAGGKRLRRAAKRPRNAGRAGQLRAEGGKPRQRQMVVGIEVPGRASAAGTGKIGVGSLDADVTGAQYAIGGTRNGRGDRRLLAEQPIDRAGAAAWRVEGPADYGGRTAIGRGAEIGGNGERAGSAAGEASDIRHVQSRFAGKPVHAARSPSDELAAGVLDFDRVQREVLGGTIELRTEPPVEPLAESAGQRGRAGYDAPQIAACRNLDRRGRDGRITHGAEIDGRAGRRDAIVIERKLPACERETRPRRFERATQRERQVRGAAEAAPRERRKRRQIRQVQLALARQSATVARKGSTRVEARGALREGKVCEADLVAGEIERSGKVERAGEQRLQPRRQQRCKLRIAGRADAIACVAADAECGIERRLRAGMKREAAAPVRERTAAREV